MTFEQEHMIWEKYICLGVMVMLFTGCGDNEDNAVVEKHSQEPAHGSFDYYYIYDSEKTKPKYCHLIDWNGASPVTELIVY